MPSKQPRPTLPTCPRCGIAYGLRFTRAHRSCIREQQREDRRAERERERLAREWMTIYRQHRAGF